MKQIRMSRSITIPFLIIVFGVISTGIALAAWNPNFNSAPYNGYFWLHTTSNHQVGVAQNIKWSSAGVGHLLNDWSPRFDMTADCTSNSPGGDKLYYHAYFTNVPNYGLSAKNDCGSWWGPKEETELWINANAVLSTGEYYHQVHFLKNQTGVSGEINLTYQRTSPVNPTHDHIDKVLYNN